MGTSGWTRDRWNTTSQSGKSHTPCSPHPQPFLLKCSPPKPWASLGFLSMSTLLGPAINFLSSKLQCFHTVSWFGLTMPRAHELVSNYSTRHRQDI